LLKTGSRRLDRICALVSGGLDSCVLAARLAEVYKEVHPVYVGGGLLWEDVEIHWLARFLAQLDSGAILPLRKIELPMNDIYNGHWSTTGKAIPDHRSDDLEVYLPGRNLLLLSKTAVFCALNQIPTVALGLLKGNPFSDSTPDFLRQFADSAEVALGVSLQILTPFSDFSKADVIALGRHLPLHLSFSCIHPVGTLHCGACNKCAERKRSFKIANVKDLTVYSTAPQLDE
jgi:7-cyano-7-deazaguanine synthase